MGRKYNLEGRNNYFVCTNPHCAELSRHHAPMIARGSMSEPCSTCGKRMVAVPPERSPLHNPDITLDQLKSDYFEELKQQAPGRIYGSPPSSQKPWRKGQKQAKA